MQLEQTQFNLLLYKRLKQLRIEIAALKKTIIVHRGESDQRFKGVTERNKEIYKLHKEKLSYVAIAKKYNLSATRIAAICRHIEYKRDKERRR